jgi:hypothetical protein
MVGFFKKGNIYYITRHTSLRKGNILGISFADKTSRKDPIEVVEWNFLKSDFTKYLEKRMAKWEKSESSKIGTSKEEVLTQVLEGLKSMNKALETDYQLSKIYYVPSEDGSNFMYQSLIRMLITHYHSGNEFKEV